MVAANDNRIEMRCVDVPEKSDAHLNNWISDLKQKYDAMAKWLADTAEEMKNV